MHICLCIICVAAVNGGQKRPSDISGLELQTVLSSHVDAGNCRSSEQADSTLNCRPISPNLKKYILNHVYLSMYTLIKPVFIPHITVFQTLFEKYNFVW